MHLEHESRSFRVRAKRFDLQMDEWGLSQHHGEGGVSDVKYTAPPAKVIHSVLSLHILPPRLMVTVSCASG
jgi:hypothetical protein